MRRVRVRGPNSSENLEGSYLAEWDFQTLSPARLFWETPMHVILVPTKMIPKLPAPFACACADNDTYSSRFAHRRVPGTTHQLKSSLIVKL